MRAGRFRRAAVRGLPAVIVSSGVSPALSQLASGVSHPRGAPLADLRCPPGAFAGPRVRSRRLKGRDMGLALLPAAKTLLSERGYDPVLGARPLRRTIQREIGRASCRERV